MIFSLITNFILIFKIIQKPNNQTINLVINYRSIMFLTLKEINVPIIFHKKIL